MQEDIVECADVLYRNKERIKLSGLLSGDGGIALFFAYLTKVYPDGKYEDITYEYLEKLGTALTTKRLSHDMSTGIAGIGFVFQHLRNIGLLDPMEDINLCELDEVISAGAEQDFKNGNWDPLHGLVGLGIYFIERFKETGEKKYLEKVVDQLAALSSVTRGYKVWITAGFRQFSKDNYNFGMAHGMPGILSFLSQVFALGIRKVTITDLVNSCLGFLLTYRDENQAWYSFPGSLEISEISATQEPKPRPSRNGWCYGDLGMANALIHCGKALDRPEWKQMGIDIALKTIHIPFSESGCADAPFCHGSLGLVHQYLRLYRATKINSFAEAADKWLDITRKYYYKPDIYISGYAQRIYDEATEEFTFISSYGLLEGIAGIGLVLLAGEHQMAPDWDIIFQTNI